MTKQEKIALVTVGVGSLVVLLAGTRLRWKQWVGVSAQSAKVGITVAIANAGETIQASEVVNGRIVVYTQYGFEKYIDKVKFEPLGGNKMRGEVELELKGGLRLYAFYIKLNNHLGRVFCANNRYSLNCHGADLVLGPGVNTFDFSYAPLAGGDIGKQDGRVGAYDIAELIANIGLKGSGDIDANGVVDGMDYKILEKGLESNSVDDEVKWKFLVEPTKVMIPTATPTIVLDPTETISPTPTDYQQNIDPTGTPLATPTQLLTVAPTPTSVPTLTPTPTIRPTATPTPTTRPTSTPTPTPTVLSSGGICRVKMSGRTYISGSYFGFSFNECRLVNGETFDYCVSTESECNVTNAQTKSRNFIDVTTQMCAGQYGATINWGQSNVSSDVQFIPSNSCQETAVGCDGPEPPRCN